jgi:hypothetical protein
MSMSISNSTLKPKLGTLMRCVLVVGISASSFISVNRSLARDTGRERVVEHSVMSMSFAPTHHHSNQHDFMPHRSRHRTTLHLTFAAFTNTDQTRLLQGHTNLPKFLRALMVCLKLVVQTLQACLLG